MTHQNGYLLYRGKCRPMAEAAAAADPSLTVVRGHYYCPVWNTEEPHWWCETPDGGIVDPTQEQFPSAGMGFYTPLDGSSISCEQCGKSVEEADAVIYGRYALCSSECVCRLVGL